VTRSIAAVVGDLLIAAGLKLAVAESCTGGLVGHLITEVPGSSSYFLGGVIAYDDPVKISVLGVPAGLIREHGAVSAECALAMAKGVRDSTGSGLGIGVTGIAGPDGGTAAKPVGTVFVALDADGFSKVQRFQWTGDRTENKQRSADAALEMVIDYLENAGRAARGSDASSNNISKV